MAPGTCCDQSVDPFPLVGAPISGGTVLVCLALGNLLAAPWLFWGRGSVPFFPWRSLNGGEENLNLLLEVLGNLPGEVISLFRIPGRKITEGLLDRFPACHVSNGVDVPSPTGVGAKLLSMLWLGGVRPSPAELCQPLLAEGLGPGPGPQSLMLLRGGDPTVGRAISLCFETGAEPGNGEALSFSHGAPGGQHPRHRSNLEGSPVVPGEGTNGPGDDSASRVGGIRATARISRVEELSGPGVLGADALGLLRGRAMPITRQPEWVAEAGIRPLAQRVHA